MTLLNFTIAVNTLVIAVLWVTGVTVEHLIGTGGLLAGNPDANRATHVYSINGRILVVI